MSNLDQALMVLRHESELLTLARHALVTGELAINNRTTVDVLQETAAEHAAALDDLTERVDSLNESDMNLCESIELMFEEPFMTAVQYADHNELDEVCLNVLGKIAKRIAGEHYTTISHVKYGHVGYLQVCVWDAALLEYYEEHGTLIPVRVLLNLHGLDVPKEDRHAIEFLTQQYSDIHGHAVSTGEATCRHPEGEPLFSVVAIDKAIELFAVVMNLHSIIDTYRQ